MELKALGLIFNKYTLAAVLLGLLTWTGYNWALNRGIERGRAAEQAIWKPQYDQVAGERAKYKGLYEAADLTNKNQITAHTKAEKELKEGYELILANQKRNLDAAISREVKLKAKYETIVPFYVPPAADKQCVIGAGFVRLHDDAAKGLDPSDSYQSGSTAPVSSGGLPDAGAPSGVALSEVASVIAWNYQEAIARGKLLEEWRTWYSGAFTEWKKAVETQKDFSIVMPSPPYP